MIDFCITADSIVITADDEETTADLACCPVEGELVEDEVNKLATEYREATKLIGLIRALLGQSELAGRHACAIPTEFDLDYSVGDQLTIIGKWLGFPRCHCVCDAPPVAGYGCDGAYTGPFTLAGYCAPGSTLLGCPPLGNSTLCVDDDEAYRAILKARRYQMLGLYDIASLQAAARHVWGSHAQVLSATVGEVILSPGRYLHADDIAQLPIIFRALPIAPGIKGLVNLSNVAISGYGEGWGGYCDGSGHLCATDPHTYTCA